MEINNELNITYEELSDFMKDYLSKNKNLWFKDGTVFHAKGKRLFDVYSFISFEENKIVFYGPLDDRKNTNESNDIAITKDVINHKKMRKYEIRTINPLWSSLEKWKSFKNLNSELKVNEVKSNTRRIKI